MVSVQSYISEFKQFLIFRPFESDGQEPKCLDQSILRLFQFLCQQLLSFLQFLSLGFIEVLAQTVEEFKLEPVPTLLSSFHINNNLFNLIVS